jgi:hypothetical protein
MPGSVPGGEKAVARWSTWDGMERRSGEDRRAGEERRSEARSIWERRSGHDRRGHKLYSALVDEPARLEVVEPDRLSDTG